MNLTPAAFNLLTEQLQGDLLQLLPELLLAAVVVLLPLCKMLGVAGRVHLGTIAFAFAGVATLIAGSQLAQIADLRGGPLAFTGLLLVDPFAIFVRFVILAFLLLLTGLTCITDRPDADEAADFYPLLFGSALGTLLMASANHLLMLFLAVEMASLPGYALAAFGRGRRLGSEAALKYVLYGAVASATMLYGISLLVATFGTGYLPHVVGGVGRTLPLSGFTPPVAAGLVLVAVGLAFKLAAVPYHFWLPDVFAGAWPEVAAFLSVASKGAALALAARLLFGIHLAVPPDFRIFSTETVGLTLCVVACLTTTWGNVAALGQRNLQRLLAYSTIANAGILLLGIAVLSRDGLAALLFYFAGYAVANLGAFAVVALLAARRGGDVTTSYRGLASRSPLLAGSMVVFLLSLLGLPPLVGFAGKLQLFATTYNAGTLAADSGSWMAGVYWATLGIALVNTVVSAGYYLMVIREMVLETPAEGAEPIRSGFGARLIMGVCVAAVLGLGLVWNPLTRASADAVGGFTSNRDLP